MDPPATTSDEVGAPVAARAPDGESSPREHPYADPAPAGCLVTDADTDSSGRPAGKDTDRPGATAPLSAGPPSAGPPSADLLSADPQRPPARDSWPALVGLLLLFLAVTGTMSGISQAHDDRYSPLDEITHVAYAYDVAHFMLPYPGSLYAQPILDDWTCRGQVNLPTALPPCGSGTLAADFPLHGLQYNAFHPPLYYAATGFSARFIDHFIPGFHFTVIARSLGAVWLAAAMFFLFLALRYWRLPWLVSISSALMLAAIPDVVHSARIVTNDIAGPLCGVAAIFVLGRVLRYRQYGWVLPAVLTALAAATKTINAVPLIAVGIVLGILGIGRWIRRDRAGALPLVRIGLAIGLSALAVYGIWAGIQAARTSAGYVNPIRAIPAEPQFTGLPFAEWFSANFAGFDLVHGYYLHPSSNGLYLHGVADIIAVVIAAAVPIAVVVFAQRTAARALGLVLMAGCLLYPLMVQIFWYIQSEGRGYFPTFNVRYGMSLLPVALAVLTMVAARRRGLQRSWACLSIGSLAVVGATVVGLLASG